MKTLEDPQHGPDAFEVDDVFCHIILVAQTWASLVCIYYDMTPDATVIFSLTHVAALKGKELMSVVMAAFAPPLPHPHPRFLPRTLRLAGKQKDVGGLEKKNS